MARAGRPSELPNACPPPRIDKPSTGPIESPCTEAPAIWKQLAVGGVSVVPAVVLTHPIDTIKLRLQLQGTLKPTAVPKYNGMVTGLATIVREEGAARLFVGMSPALCRAFTFSALRIGMYEPLRDIVANSRGQVEPTFSTKLAAGVSSGAMGAVAGNPFELLKVRMQSPGPTYRNVFHGLATVCKQEGVRTLWNGTNAATLRAGLFSSSQLATYDQAKGMLQRHCGARDGWQTAFGAAMTAGLVTTTVSAPADYVKSIVMHSRSGVRPLSVVRDAFMRDGGRSFFRGWLPMYSRLGPHTLLTLMSVEAVRKLVGWKAL